MKAVVMAGGFGTRIQPLTARMPKPMIPVFNRPMMEYIIRSLKDLGVYDIIVLLYFKPDVITSYFGDGSHLGVRMHYVTPDDDFGTAGAVKKAQRFLDERFIVVSGDLITDIKLPEIVRFHEVKKSTATITLTSVSDPLQFGVVMADKEGRILRFLEKPGWGEVFSDTINTGIYVLEPEVLNYIPENRNFDFSKDLFPALMSKGITLFGFNAKGYWRDVGNPDSYRSCMNDITEGKVTLSIPGNLNQVDNAVCYTGDNVHIGNNVVFKGVVAIGNNCTLHDDIVLDGVALGDGCTVGRGSQISKSVIWDCVKVGEECKLTNSVLCYNVVLGKNVESFQGVIIADNTEVGDRVLFDKDVTVWPDKQIESGSIVSSSLIWGDKWKSSIFEGGKVGARTNMELSPEMSAKLGAAFGSILPRGVKVLVGRDYHRASRMLKRAFLGGLISTGVNAVDLKMEAVPVMRYKLSSFGEMGGVYFRQHHIDPTQTEILFFDEHGNALDSGIEKNIERIFFRDNFRRTPHDEVGEIVEHPMVREFYREGMLKMLDLPVLNAARLKVVVNLMNGNTALLLPDILNKIGAEAIILNAYQDEARLSRTFSQKLEVERQTSEITRTLKADAGIVVYPSGERFVLLTDTGEVVKEDRLLLLMLLLLDRSAKPMSRVYLPVYVPTVMDSSFRNIEIVRGKFTGIKAHFLRDFAFSGTINNLFSFTGHMAHYDAMFASIKLLEMAARINVPLSELYSQLPDYKYYHSVISCPLDLKGYLMRKMSEEAMDKDASFVDGVKITYKHDAWVHMLPDQYSPNVHLYVEGLTAESADKLHSEYVTLINRWMGGYDKRNAELT
ncbi:MAG: NTP transferase domain-containing protein [Deferribacteraceae bacterium]|jgi:mannose-1-phosphate guanylyltransferase/phosphomannomutase|nr:NTP transferase domain-containing protein [Deferribacteraceae bacterium]